MTASAPIIKRAVASLDEAQLRALVASLIVEDSALVADSLAAVLETAPDLVDPTEVVDRDGDRWTRGADGRFSHGSMDARTLDRLRADYGPLTLPGAAV